MPAVFRDILDMQRTSGEARSRGLRIAVVPTMGSLHEGHLSLIRTAKQHAGIVVTTVFVNPAQFGPTEDYARYPRNLEKDVALAESAGTDVVFAPGAPEMYPPGYGTWVYVDALSSILEGKSRPGHFQGVATVVTKLFNIVQPHVAVFGQKDAQQVAVIRALVGDLNMGIDLIVAPTVREADGLALSSRNSYLTAEQRAEAPVLFRSLRLAEQRLREGMNSAATIAAEMSGFIRSNSQGEIDYISVADADTLRELEEIAPGQSVLVSLAVRFGTTRLIDNVIGERKRHDA